MTDARPRRPPQPAETRPARGADPSARRRSTPPQYPLALTSADEARRVADGPGLPARRLSAAPPGPARRAAAGGRRRLHRRGQVDPGQQPGPGPGQRGRRAAARPPASPVLVCNPADTRLVPPGRPAARADPHHRRRAPTRAPCSWSRRPRSTPGLAFLDAPDIDSVVDANRQLAAQLLAAADLWLFVTTAARYADAVPWELLRTARLRGTVIALVLDRVPPEAADEVARAPAARCWPRNDLAAAPLFVLPETDVDGQGLLPERVIAPLRDWFARLAADADARAAVVRQTLDGALAALGPAVDGLADAADDQAAAADALRERVRGAYRAAARDGRARAARRPAAARRGARPLAGVRRHRRVLPRAGGADRAAARPDRRRGHRPPGARHGAAARRSSRSSSRCCAGSRRTPPSRRTPAGRPTRPERRCSSRRCSRPSRRPRRARRPAGPRLAARGARPGPRRGRRQAVRGAHRRVRGQRHRPGRDDRRVRLHRVHPDRPGDRGRRRHHGRRAEGARGDLRRPGDPHASPPRPGRTCSTGSTTLLDEEAARYFARIEAVGVDADPGGELRASAEAVSVARTQAQLTSGDRLALPDERPPVRAEGPLSLPAEGPRGIAGPASS